MKERLDTATQMNHNLQRKLNICKKKADQYDNERQRCQQLEIANQELIRLLGGSLGGQIPAQLSQISAVDYAGVSSEDQT